VFEKGEHAACTGEVINAYKIVVRTPEVKRPCGSLLHRGCDKIMLKWILEK
jgi:hypothetical protein